MHRRSLLTLLSRHRPFDDSEAAGLARTVQFVRDHADCFERTNLVGHITGSAWLLDAKGTRVLLTHHKKLGKWLQLGGHADGEIDVLQVALREAREESGLTAIEPVSEAIFDIDVHRIPRRGDEPEHDHYDVRFLLRTAGTYDGAPYCVSDESHGLAWVTKAELLLLGVDESVLRMHRKWPAT